MKKYVLVGCGARGILSYAIPMVKKYGDYAKLCGVYDSNRKRGALVSEYVGEDIPCFDNFTEMLETVKPDTVIVTTVDCFHDEYIIGAMGAGCDVISEKPLTTTFEKCLAIQEAQKRTGKNITVTFNLRFHPFFSRLKEMVASGILGEILNVHYEWMLGVEHGADYFRRWHGERKNSGSLLVHKSTHHFDIANWLLEQDPVAVHAFGTRRIYGPTREKRSQRCLTCPYKRECEMYLDICQDQDLRKMYYECEDVDGYYRDRCVFGDRIDIEDTASVSVLYSGGCVMSYSLTAFSPYEGMRIVLNGTKGRMEATNCDNHVRILHPNGEEYSIDLPKDGSGGHGGADEKLWDSLFKGTKPQMEGQMADLRAGMMSIGIGMAANISMREGRRVTLNEFFGVSK